MLSQTVATIVLSVSLVAMFITVYFFTYGIVLEKESTKNQIDYICKDFVSDITIAAPDVATRLASVLDTVQLPNSQAAQDQQTAASNAALERNTFIALGVLSGVGVGFAIALIIKYKLPVARTIIPTLIMATAVAVVYFLFSKFFVAMYRSADPNFVKLQVLKKLYGFAAGAGAAGAAGAAGTNGAVIAKS